MLCEPEQGHPKSHALHRSGQCRCLPDQRLYRKLCSLQPAVLQPGGHPARSGLAADHLPSDHAQQQHSLYAHHASVLLLPGHRHGAAVGHTEIQSLLSQRRGADGCIRDALQLSGRRVLPEYEPFPGLRNAIPPGAVFAVLHHPHPRLDFCPV